MAPLRSLLLFGIAAVLAAEPLEAVAGPPVKDLYGTLPKGPFIPPASGKAMLVFLLLAHREARSAGIPVDLVNAVMKIESGHDPSRIGSVGEIGLMQVRPSTAALLGFKGAQSELARPDINIHYGTTYLGQAWHMTNGDICRTLMKYRAGHGEERMTPLSDQYCARARAHLAAIGSPLASGPAGTVMPAMPAPAADVYEAARHATGRGFARPLHGRAFWAAEEAHVRAVTLRLEAKWHRLASR